MWQVTGDRWPLTGDKCKAISDSFINYSLRLMINDSNIDVRYSLLKCLYNMERLSSSVVSIQDFEEEILDSNPHGLQRRMNIYTFDIFTNHCMDVEEIDEPGRYGLRFHYLEIWLFNLPDFSHMAIVKEAVWNISSLSILSNWWTGFLTWQDFFLLLRKGTNLPIHSVVLDVNRIL